MTRKSAPGDIAVFMLIFLPLTGLAQFLLLRFSTSPSLTITLMMFSVGIAALAALRCRNRPISEIGWEWGSFKYHLVALAAPFIYAGLAYAVSAGFGLVEFGSIANLTAFRDGAGLEEFPLAEGVLLALALTFLGLLPTGFVRALGEEIGWRGFLTPRLNLTFGFVAGTFLTGVAWGAWHMPIILLWGYNAGGPLPVEALAFMAMVIAISGIFAWLRTASGSVWPAATLHAAHNLIIQSIFDPLTTRGEHELTMVGEFGLVLAVTTVVVSLPFWVMGARNWKSSQ